jgi:hypothetical protein
MNEILPQTTFTHLLNDLCDGLNIKGAIELRDVLSLPTQQRQFVMHFALNHSQKV